jgi:hypothetical protein
VILAEFEVWHSRPVVPTRRVALGADDLPTDPLPGFGGLLLAGVIANFVSALRSEHLDALDRLMDDVEAGLRIPQPRLRHRLQVDRVGLRSSLHRLMGDGESLSFDFEAGAPPAPQVLAAVYRTGRLEPLARRSIMSLLRSAARWRGVDHTDLVAYLCGRDPDSAFAASQHVDPVAWAMSVLGFDTGLPTRREVQRRFRMLLRAAHPDAGGEGALAARRIGLLTEARDILVA